MADDVEVDITGDAGSLIEALQAAADAAEELAAIIRQLRDDLEETDGASQAAAAGLHQVTDSLAGVNATAGAAAGMLQDLAGKEEEVAAGAEAAAAGERALGDEVQSASADMEAQAAIAKQLGDDIRSAGIAGASGVEVLKAELTDLEGTLAADTALATAFEARMDALAAAMARVDALGALATPDPAKLAAAGAEINTLIAELSKLRDTSIGGNTAGPFVEGLLQADSAAAKFDAQLAAIKSTSGDANAAFAKAVDEVGKGHAAFESTAIAVAELDKVLAKAANDASGWAAVGAVLANAGSRITTAWATATSGIRIFGVSFNALHWIVGLSGELLAVAVPAAYALAAGMAVAAEGAQRAAVRMGALYTVQESLGRMFHETAGQYLGIGSALQKAQTAADPRVYQMLGAAISEAKNGAAGFSQVGTQMVGIFDKFLAEADLAMKSGGFQSLLAGAARDLTGLGQALGNIGHAFINWARDMPGLAAVLLQVLDVVTRIVSVFAGSTVGGWVILLAMGLEEAYRWGGLLATVISKVLIAARFAVETLGELATAIGSTSAMSGLQSMAAGLLGLNKGADAAKVSLGEMDAEAALMSGEMDALAASEGIAAAATGALTAAIDFLAGPLGWIAIAAAVGFGFLIDKILTAKNAVGQMAASLQASAEKSTNINALNSLATGYVKMGSAASKAASQVKAINQSMPVTNKYGEMARMAKLNASGATSAYATATSAQQKFAQEAGNVVMGALRIQKAFGTSFVGALGLADEAGVKLMNGITNNSQQAKTAWQQLINTVSGMQAMTGNGGAFGAALNVIGVQAQLAATKVSQLQQATGAFLTSGTSGTDNFSQLVATIGSLNKHALSTTVSMSGLFGSLKTGGGKLAATFKGLGANAMQSWQQFDSALSGPGSNLLQWFQQAGAEGMMTKGSLTQSMRDIVGAFLPMSAGSRAATKELSMYAQMVGGPATASSRKLYDWLKRGGQAFKTTGGYLKNLQNIVNGTQIGMAGLNNVAKNLGAMAEQVKLKAYGVDKAMQTFADSVTQHMGTKKIASAFQNMQSVLGKAFGPTGRKYGEGYAAGFGKAGQQAAKSFQSGLTAHMKAALPTIKPKISVDGIAKAKQQLDQVKQSADQALKNPPDMKVKLTGIDQAMSDLSKLKSYTAQIPGSFATAQSAISGHVSQIASDVGRLGPAFSRARSVIASSVAAIVSTISPLPGRIRAVFSPLPGEMTAIGNSIGEGLAAGIRASTGAAVAAAAAMAAAVTKAAQVHLGVHSPSTVFAKIGRSTVQGFIDGLLGGRAAVTAAMNLIFGAHAHNNTIQKWINKMRREVRAAFTAGVIGSRQDSWFTRLIREDNKRLQKLARERKTIENEIKAADALARSVQSGAETGANVVSSFGMTFAGLNQTSKSYPTIQKAMKANLASIRQFRSDIARLKKEGLSKQIIKQLLGAGVSGGLPIAEQLLKGGNVKEIDKLQAEIDKASKKLGITGANAAYESGREIGKGLAAGLKSQLRVIEDAMRRIARELVRAIRQALRIKSPSQVMKEVGMLTGLGLAQGMDAAGGVVRAAAARMGARATDGLMLSARAAPRNSGTGPAQVIQNHITLQVDGKTLARTMQVHSLRHAHRNPATGLKLAGRNI